MKTLNEKDWNKDAKNIKKKIKKIEELGKSYKKDEISFLFDNIDWKERAMEMDTKSISLLWSEFNYSLATKNMKEYRKFAEDENKARLKFLKDRSDSKSEIWSFLEPMLVEYAKENHQENMKELGYEENA